MKFLAIKLDCFKDLDDWPTALSNRRMTGLYPLGEEGQKKDRRKKGKRGVHIYKAAPFSNLWANLERA